MATAKGGATPDTRQGEAALEIARGDFVLVVSADDYGKLRPALVLQSDLVNGTHHSVSVCHVTSTLVEAPLVRVLIKALKRNGLNTAYQVMIDKVQSARRDRIKDVSGSAN